MFRARRAVIVGALLAGLVFEADADSLVLWLFQPPTHDTAGNQLDPADRLSYELHCNTTAGQLGPPYEVVLGVPDANGGAAWVDLDPVFVDGPGQYACRGNTTSEVLGTTSELSQHEWLFYNAIAGDPPPRVEPVETRDNAHERRRGSGCSG